jgi:hypothetical protein
MRISRPVLLAGAALAVILAGVGVTFAATTATHPASTTPRDVAVVSTVDASNPTVSTPVTSAVSTTTAAATTRRSTTVGAAATHVARQQVAPHDVSTTDDPIVTGTNDGGVPITKTRPVATTTVDNAMCTTTDEQGRPVPYPCANG